MQQADIIAFYYLLAKRDLRCVQAFVLLLVCGLLCVHVLNDTEWGRANVYYCFLSY